MKNNSLYPMCVCECVCERECLLVSMCLSTLWLQIVHCERVKNNTHDSLDISCFLSRAVQWVKVNSGYEWYLLFLSSSLTITSVTSVQWIDLHEDQCIHCRERERERERWTHMDTHRHTRGERNTDGLADRERDICSWCTHRARVTSLALKWKTDALYES